MISRYEKNKKKSVKQSIKNIKVCTTLNGRSKNQHKKKKIKYLKDTKKKINLKGGQYHDLQCSNFSTNSNEKYLGCRQPFWSSSCR